MHQPADRDDFDAFYRATVARSLRYAYAMSGDVAAAQDLTAEAYMRAWLHWPAIRGHDSAVVWVRRTVARLAVDRWRHLRIRRRYESTATTAAVPGPDEDLVVLVAALRRLPVRQREAVVLHYLADRSVAQIAAETGAAEGTVKSWLSRGRAALAAALRIEPDGQEVTRVR